MRRASVEETRMSKGDDRVIEELGRILASEPFAASPMLASFLRYVVEETLAGRGDRLKAYTIAIGALERSDDFDPNDNPLVRVQARRLRQALERYYFTEGRGSDLVIELPLGTYVPNFVERSAAPEAAPPPAPAGAEKPHTDDAPAPRDVRRPMPRGRLAFVALTVVLVAALAAGVWYGLSRIVDPPPSARGSATSGWPETRSASDTDPAAAVGLDATRVLPLLTVTVVTGSPPPPEFDPEVYRNRIEGYARRFDDAIVVTRRSADFPPPIGQPLYRLRALVVREGGTNNVYLQLVHAGDERLVDSVAVTLDVIRGPNYTAFDLPSDLAFVRNSVRVHGTISRDLAAVGDIGPELACIAKTWQYFLESTRRTHRDARDCLTAVVASNPRLVPALTMLGEIYIGEYRQSLDDTSDDPLARADELLGRASRLAPGSSAVFRVLENLLLLRGDTDAAVRAATAALRNNPDDADAIGGLGAVFARLGRYEEAIDLMMRAEAATSTPPKWMQFYTFLAFNNLDRTREADERVAFFDGTTSSLYLAAAAIRAHRRGDEAAAAAAIAAIHEIEPTLRNDPKGFLRRRGFTDTVADRLLIDLRAAGLLRSRT
jgi:tetratricopeptide (TPR) repeat protein